MGASLAEQMRPDAWLCRGRRGRRDGGQGGCLLPQGACPAGMHPPIFFSILWKRKRAVHGPKEKTALVATLHMRAKLLCEGRRERVPAGLRGLYDGRGGVPQRLDS